MTSRDRDVAVPIVNLDAEQLEYLLDRAAKRGAQRALEDIGLHEENAAQDIRELREVLNGWRDTKKTAKNAAVKWITVAILGFIALAVYDKAKIHLR